MARVRPQPATHAPDEGQGTTVPEEEALGHHEEDAKDAWHIVEPGRDDVANQWRRAWIAFASEHESEYGHEQGEDAKAAAGAA